MSELPSVVFNFVRTHANKRERVWAAEQSHASTSTGRTANHGSSQKHHRAPVTWSQTDTLQPDFSRIHTSSRTLSRMRLEKSLPHSQELDRLVQILKDHQVPGPQLFRLETEFCNA